MPYWGSIVTLTLALRTLTLPIHIQTMKNAAKLAIARPEMEALSKKMQNMQNPTPEQQVKVSLEMQALMKKHGVNPIKNILYPFLQMPIFVSMFFGLKEMGAHFPGFATGGFGPFTDLAAADPSYILPIATGVLFLGMVELGSPDMPETAMSKNMKMFMRVMAITMPPLTYQFPSGVFIYWMTSNAFTLMQSLALKIPTVKAALGIPEIPQEVKNSMVEEVHPEMKDNFLYKKQMEAVTRKSKMQHDILKKAAELKKAQKETK